MNLPDHKKKSKGYPGDLDPRLASLVILMVLCGSWTLQGLVVMWRDHSHRRRAITKGGFIAMDLPADPLSPRCWVRLNAFCLSHIFSLTVFPGASTDSEVVQRGVNAAKNLLQGAPGPPPLREKRSYAYKQP